jgi:hypothetical protein
VIDETRTMHVNELARRAQHAIDEEGSDAWYEADWLSDDDGLPEADAAYIEAADPATVLALVARVRELESASLAVFDTACGDGEHWQRVGELRAVVQRGTVPR